MPILINPSRETPVWEVNSGVVNGTDNTPLEAATVNFTPTLGDALFYATTETGCVIPNFGSANDPCYYQPFIDNDVISIQYQVTSLNNVLITQAVRDALNGGDFWDIIGGNTGGNDFLNDALAAISLYNDCNCTAFTVSSCKPIELFFGVFVDVDQSRALGWLGYDSNGNNTDINKTVFKAYFWIKVYTSSSFPDTWHLRAANPAGGIFRTQTYKRISCKEPSFLIESRFTYLDTWGAYYGLPYGDFWAWIEPDPAIPPTVCHVPVTWNGQCGGRVNAPFYRNKMRVSGYLEVSGYETEQVNWNKYNGATRGVKNDNYSVRCYPMPEFMADIIAMHNTGQKTYINNINVKSTSAVTKNNDNGEYFIPVLDYQRQTDTDDFCAKCN